MTPSEPMVPESRVKRARLVGRARGIVQALASQLGPEDLVIDCGANQGLVTLPLAATGAEVIAFEPDPLAHDALAAKLADLPNVTLHQKAVGVSDGTATLYRSAGFEADPLAETVRSTTTPGGVQMAEEGQAVPRLDLPKLLRELAKTRPRGIAFLKLDIEGAELDILTEMLRHRLFDTVRLTVAEMHGYKFPAIKEEFVALRKTIAQRFPEERVWLHWV